MRRWVSGPRPPASLTLPSSTQAASCWRCSAAQALAEDAGVAADKPGFSGVALAHNVQSETDVDSVLAEAVAAGAKLLKPGQKAFWGGYSGYFADPDGHVWEVAYNPFMPLDEAGRVTLPAPTT